MIKYIDFTTVRPSLSGRQADSPQYRPWEAAGASAEENSEAPSAFEAVLTVTASTNRSNQEYQSIVKRTKQLAIQHFGYGHLGELSILAERFFDAALLYCNGINSETDPCIELRYAQIKMQQFPTAGK